ncbi:MAG: aminoglycoside phosphotransferase family protein, partial [Clostridia bacterium]|nr:aminoglycoside phosphotransferase family protein [Clostridia bacterium]MBQ8333399.1 aminoglycoside phosphotransferase family protein [Clostridia bacterium]MBQ8369608.1 aminoglycoside phosphotransferase family protein [Clostridia bacterium]MBQ8511487.1 aminoglycoside phosphotransferase family protein [Clostridia bacterium]
MSIQAKVLVERSAKTIYLDQETVIKQFDRKYPTSVILSEAHCQALAAENGLKAPRVLRVDNVDGQWAIHSEYIPGVTLWEAMKSAEDMGPLLDRFVDFQMSLHDTELRDLPCLHEFAAHKLALSPLDSVKRYELQNILENMPEEKKICHCDFVPWNIILRNDNPDDPYILDWPFACHGNKDADVAQTFLTFNVYGESALAVDYVKLYAEKSGSYLRGILRWVPILAACRIVSPHIEERKTEHAILEHFANVSNLKI